MSIGSKTVPKAQASNIIMICETRKYGLVANRVTFLLQFGHKAPRDVVYGLGGGNQRICEDKAKSSGLFYERPLIQKDFEYTVYQEFFSLYCTMNAMKEKP